MTENIDAEYFEPLFRSAHEALRFAYLFSGQQYPMSLMAKLMRGIVGSGKGLVGLDGAAQAGFIILMVKELRPALAAGLVARYAEQQDPRFIQAVNVLTMDSMASISGMSHRLLRQALIARHFGHKVNLGEVAEKCQLHRNTVGNQQRIMRGHLQKVEEMAYARITAIMLEKRLIE